MQTKSKKNKPVTPIQKPILIGSYHGKDAWKLALKRFFSVFLCSILYLIIGILVTVDHVALSLTMSILISGLLCYYQFVSGATQGEKDASFSEIMYLRNEEGKTIVAIDRNRCFHPMKGFFATAIGLLPYLIFTTIYACVTQLEIYELGVLPSWTSTYLGQSEISDALNYYSLGLGMQAMDIMRVITRAMVMPFITTANYVSKEAVLWVERFSPLLITIAPIGYAFGYTQGAKIRTKINTGIQQGVAKKKRKQRKERKARQASNTPERLI